MKNLSVCGSLLLLLCAAVVSLLLLTSCAADPSYHPLTQSADRFVNQTVGPEYEAYVRLGLIAPVTDEQVAALMAILPQDMYMSADEMRIRLTNVRMFRTAVAQAKGEGGEPQ